MTLHPIQISKEVVFSRLVYGVWRLHEDKEGNSSKRILEKVEVCLSLGIDTFDHADIYGNFGNEELFGKALAEKPEWKTKIKLISKTGIQIPNTNIRTKHYNTGSEHILRSAENSLRNLGVPSLDLLLIHRPDPLLHPEEVASTFTKLKTSGKVKSFGVSNFTISQFAALQSKCDFPLVTNQVEFHPFHTEPLFDGTFDQALQFGFAPMIWSPTAGGRVFSPNTEQEKNLKQSLDVLAKKYGATPDQILYSWYLRHPANLIPVLGTNDTERIRSAVKAFEFPLTREEWFEILEKGRGREVP
ncbi:aldo/keto reductase [Leptospira idonii]|uniref:Oxidoreductase n=1 Tax=Leptospira idonii TaxID=1193500 RepID=A0A4V3JXW2_9LEPT|nr:aldo/keto reductase [Leptospira idonii]TGN18936.1 oxidoreductase [Leptospira idonii]